LSDIVRLGCEQRQAGCRAWVFVGSLRVRLWAQSARISGSRSWRPRFAGRQLR